MMMMDAIIVNCLRAVMYIFVNVPVTSFCNRQVSNVAHCIVRVNVYNVGQSPCCRAMRNRRRNDVSTLSAWANEVPRWGRRDSL